MKFYLEKLIQIRELRKMTLVDIAKKSSISRQSLWAWETGKRIPTPSNVRALANTLEVDVSEISDLKSVKDITEKTYSKSLHDLQEVSSITKKINPEKINTLESIVNSLKEELFNSAIVINSLIYSMDFGFYVKGINQKYILANETFLKMFNLNKEFDIFGKKDSNIFPFREACINTSQDETIINTGNSLVDKEYYLPGTRKTRWGLISKLPIFDMNKDIIGVMGVFKDITEKRNAEQKRISLECALDSINAGVWISEVENFAPYKSKIIYVNKFYERILNEPKENLYKDHSAWESMMYSNDLTKRKLSRKTRKFPAYYKYKLISHTNEELDVDEVVYKSDSNHLIGIITDTRNKDVNLLDPQNSK